MFKRLITEQTDWADTIVRKEPGGNFMVIIKLIGVPIYHISYSPAEAFELLYDSVVAVKNTAVICQREYERNKIDLYETQDGFVYSICTKMNMPTIKNIFGNYYESELAYMTKSETIIECVKKMMIFTLFEEEYH